MSRTIKVFYTSSPFGEGTELTLTGVRLPTKEEVETLWPQKKDREYSDDSIGFNRLPWWLQTPGTDDGYVTRVEGNGNIDSFGYPVDMEIAVRPVLEVEGLDKMDPNAKWFIVQEDDGTTARVYHRFGKNLIYADGELDVLLDGEPRRESNIILRRFDSQSNDYNGSELEQFVDEVFPGRVTEYLNGDFTPSCDDRQILDEDCR